eukprot:8993-Eustigmatos_ZCMA.PRE.1
MAYAKGESGIIERFNYTVRLSLEKAKAVRGKLIDWVFKYLPLVLDSYNNTRHKTTGQTPNAMLHDENARNMAVVKLKKEIETKLPKERLE